jgi:lysine 2,3-aminomutase
LLNQAVLLRGVNDHVDTLRALCKRLGDLGVIPYYLHHPDLTVGTQHLRVTIDRGLELTRALRGALSGYLIPRYVIEIPGGYGKVELDSHATRRGEARGQWWLRSPLNGVEHLYHDLAISHQVHPTTSKADPSEINDLVVTHASLAHCGSSPQDEESALRASDSL